MCIKIHWLGCNSHKSNQQHSNGTVSPASGGLYLRQGGDVRALVQLQGPAVEAGQHPPHGEVARSHQLRLQPLLGPSAPHQTLWPKRSLQTQPHHNLHRTQQTDRGRDNMTHRWNRCCRHWENTGETHLTTPDWWMKLVLLLLRNSDKWFQNKCATPNSSEGTSGLESKQLESFCFNCVLVTHLYKCISRKNGSWKPNSTRSEVCPMFLFVRSL